MTTARFYRNHDQLIGFSTTGHSGYAEKGEDIVCAAISSAVTLTECIINDQLHAGAEAIVDPEQDSVSLVLQESGPACTACQAVLKGLKMTLESFAAEYPQYITVLEV